MGIDFENKGYGVEFIHGEANDTLVFEREYCAEFVSYKSHYKKEKRNIKGALGESGLLLGNEAGDAHIKQDTREFMQKCRVYHFHDTSPTAEFKKAQKLTANVDLQSDASNIAPYLYRLKQDCANSYREIVSAIQTVAPFFHDFYLVPRGETGDESLLLRWSHRDHDAPFSANQLSDGTARFICMATLFLQPESIRPNTIILDEPELGLHPAALEVLAEMIKSISKKTQVICSTQSSTFANFFQPQDFIVVDQEKGISKFSRLDSEGLKVWLNEYGMGDIWMKNLIGGRPEW